MMRARFRSFNLGAAILAMALAVIGATRAAGQGEADRVDRLEAELERLRERIDELSPDAAEPPAGIALRATWRDAFYLESEDERFSLRLGGRVVVQGTAFDAERALERALGDTFDDGVEFRRVRLSAAGRLWEHFRFRVMLEFSDGEIRYRHLWAEFRGRPLPPAVTALRVGFFREPFGLESSTAVRYLSVAERSLTHALSPGRNTGAMLYGRCGAAVRWWLGAFGNADDRARIEAGNGFGFTARLAALLYGEDGADRLMHVGGAYTRRQRGRVDARLRSRPEVGRSPFIVDTGDFSANHRDGAIAEFAVIEGPWSLQAEYSVHAFDRDADDVVMQGAYAVASVFLTGDHRTYRGGRFRAVDPVEPFGALPSGGFGLGAIELAVRASALDLNDGTVRGGRVRDLTLAANWYPNKNVRLQFNWILADRARAGRVNAFLATFGVVF